MMKNILKHMMMLAFAVLFVCTPVMDSNAAQVEETEIEEDTSEKEANPLAFEIAIFEYEVVEEADQDDMPVGFTIGDWEYNGVAVKAGFTENSDMVCIMGKELETGNKYRFIYDPEHDMFVPYFGTEVKNGYIYTIPMYEDAEVPYGFMEAYFVIQTVPMFTYMREDAELTQEEIAVGSLSEDNYLVFLMMDENGKEVHYTYDLVDRTFQRSLLQKKDAEKVTELNETIDQLSLEIGKLNASHAERMNGRLTVIGVLIAAVIIMAGVIIELYLKVTKLKKSVYLVDDEPEDEDYAEEPSKKGLAGLFKKKEETFEDEEAFADEPDAYDDYEEKVEVKPTIKKSKPVVTEDDDFEILDLDLDD